MIDIWFAHRAYRVQRPIKEETVAKSLLFCSYQVRLVIVASVFQFMHFDQVTRSY